MSQTMIPAARPLIGDEEREAVDRVLRSGMLAQGPEVAAFEREFADAIVGGRSCVAVNSGTSGLHLGLLAAGVGPGDEVVVPSFTFAATANSVALTGATPVFADIDPDTYCLDVASVKEVMTDRTTGILPVHLYGHPADMTALGDLASTNGLALFEDAAQAHGATWHGRPVGSFGAFAMFSLYPTKNMTSGEGGMVACSTPTWSAPSSCCATRAWNGVRERGRRVQRPDDGPARRDRPRAAAQAAGLDQMRQRNAEFLSATSRGWTVPTVTDGAVHVWHQYTIRVSDDRDGFAGALADEHGVASGVYYPIPNHELPSFGRTLDLPVTRRACAEVLSLPVHPALSQADLERIVTAVNTVAQAGS